MFLFLLLLLCAPRLSGKSSLPLRGLVGGSRATALRAVGMLLSAPLSTLDLSDNMLTALEISLLGQPLATADTLSKLVLAGNPLDAGALAALCASVLEMINDINDASITVTDLDLTRTLMGANADGKAPPLADVAAFAKSVTLGGGLKSLSVANSAMR